MNGLKMTCKSLRRDDKWEVATVTRALAQLVQTCQPVSEFRMFCGPARASLLRGWGERACPMRNEFQEAPLALRFANAVDTELASAIKQEVASLNCRRQRF